MRLGGPRRQLAAARPTPASRRLRGVVRDAWQPSAGAPRRAPPGSCSRGGERTRVTTVAAPDPARRPAGRPGDRPQPGPARPGRPADARSRSPGASARCRRSPPASTCPAGSPCCGSSTGASAVRVRGQGTEFDSLREYVDGDDVRCIDWRATARRRTVVVRTWQPERDRRVVLVLDTSRTSAGRVDDVPRLDAAMDAALLLAALAARAGDRVDLARRRPAGPRPGRRREPRRDAARRPGQDAMAAARARARWRRTGRRWPAQVGSHGPAARAGRACSPRSSRRRSRRACCRRSPALTRHHRVVLASVRDPALSSDGRRRATASTRCTTPRRPSSTLALRERTADCCSASASHVIDAEPERPAASRSPTTTCC